MTTKITKDESEQKILNDYLADLYGTFLRKLAGFIIDEKEYSEDTRMTEVKLIALLQEITKIKKLIVLK